MPTCPDCGGHGIVPIIPLDHPAGGISPYRQCISCNGKGWISKEENAKKEYKKIKHATEKDTGFGIILIVIGILIVYFGIDKLDNSSDRIIAVIIAVALLLYGGKHL